MAWQIIWVPRALNERMQIMQYWLERNQSYTFPEKLDSLIEEALSVIEKYPYSGTPTNKENIRITYVRDYILIYEIAVDVIYILSMWDTRQNPTKLKI